MSKALLRGGKYRIVVRADITPLVRYKLVGDAGEGEGGEGA